MTSLRLIRRISSGQSFRSWTPPVRSGSSYLHQSTSLPGAKTHTAHWARRNWRENMSEADFKDIEQALGHEVDPARRDSIHDLYDIPLDILEDARKLHSLTLSYRFLQYYTSSGLWRWLLEFADEVIDHGVEL